MTSVFAELKRRNVFRVAIAYIVVGWVVLQVAEILSPILQLPEWTVSIVFYFGVIGFPFALIFAWAFELTPEGLKLTTDVSPDESITSETGKSLNRSIITLMAVAIVLLLADRFYTGIGGAGEAGTVATETAQNMSEAPEPEADGPKSIAVLPFDNMSADPDQEYFSDGISEELLNGLAKIKELQVAARTSSFAFKGDHQDIRKIGTELNVDTVLEGSVRKAGNRVRITAQLINVEDGYHLWSETYDRELNDIFAIQDEISAAIVEALKVHLMDGEMIASHKAVDLDAYNFFLQGQHSFRRRTEKSLQLAAKQFRKAIDIDPGYGDAWAGLGATTELLSEFHYGTNPVEESRRQAQEYIDRAFAIDPDLPRAHAAQALLDLNHGKPFAALKSINAAIAGNPSEGILYAWKALTLDELGRSGEGFEVLEQAYRIDPLHQTIRNNLTNTIAMRGDMQRAREMVTPDSGSAYEVEMVDAWANGRTADMIRNADEAIARAEAGVDKRLNFLRGINYYFGLKSSEQARTHTNTIFNLYLDAMEDPAATLAKLEAIPEETRGEPIQNLIGFTLIELDRCEDYLDLMAERDYLNAPVFGDMQGISDLDWARFYAWCQARTGRESDAIALASRQERYIRQAIANGQPPNYFLELAEVQVLLGDEDAAMGTLKSGWSHYDLDWADFRSPILAPLRQRPDFRELHAAVYQHMNGERAKMGWEPVEITALD